MKRILVIGCPGSGKSTVSRTLAERLSLPLIHLDKLFWQPGWLPVSREDFDKKLQAELEKETWILDGNFERTLEMRLAYADTVVFFRLPRRICIWRVLRRIWSHRGRTRADMTAGCNERLDLDFLRYIWNFEKTRVPKILAALEHATDVRVITIRTQKELDAFLETL